MLKDELRTAWNQKDVPVVIRRIGKGELLRARLPYEVGNRLWLQNGRRTAPAWRKSGAYWELPKAWFSDFVDRCLVRFSAVYVIQPFREQEICSPSCRNATGHECECSCMGLHHGQGDDGTWFDVSEAFSVRSGDTSWACRKLSRKGDLSDQSAGHGKAL